jgi:hypothetical protein
VIKKIKASDLVPGMYVHSLNADWSKHPFLRTRFLVKTQAQIDKIAAILILESFAFQ